MFSTADSIHCNGVSCQNTTTFNGTEVVKSLESLRMIYIFMSKIHIHLWKLRIHLRREVACIHLKREVCVYSYYWQLCTFHVSETRDFSEKLNFQVFILNFKYLSIHHVKFGNCRCYCLGGVRLQSSNPVLLYIFGILG